MLSSKQGVSRQDFLRGIAASLGLGAFGGWRLFAPPLGHPPCGLAALGGYSPPGWKPSGKPNLVFGVISDTHLRTTADGKYSTKYWSDRWVVAALKHFREQNVDAVVHLGDMAHLGQVEEMEFHRTAWEKVFPHDLAPDGHKVVRLFITGNHDIDGSKYGIGELVKKIHPDEEERKKHLLCTDIAANWERIWGEKYEPIWHKTVKGYHFFGRNWGVAEARTARAVKAVIGEGSPCPTDVRPFFHLSHSRPHASLNKALLPYPNAVGFFGHWHCSAANWNRIYMLSAGPTIQCPACCPQANNCLSNEPYPWLKVVPEGAEAAGKSRQGYVVRVYDDMLVIERREFSKGGSLGADWVMPLGKYDPHPFSKNELKKVIGESQFREGAKLLVECCKCENVASSNTNSQLKNGNIGIGNIGNTGNIRLSIPLADGNPDSRVYAYEVVVAGDEGTPKLSKAIYAAGCNMGIGHEPNGGMTTLEIPKSELPTGKTLTFAVRPLTSLGTSGRPIATTFTA